MDEQVRRRSWKRRQQAYKHVFKKPCQACQYLTAAEVTASTDELLPAGLEVPLGTFLGHFKLILIDLSARLAVCLPWFPLKEESKVSMNEFCGMVREFCLSGFFFFFLSLSLRKVTNNSLKNQYAPTIYEFMWASLEVL